MLFLTNPSPTLEKAEQLPNLELVSLLSRFYGPVQTKKSMNGVYKTNVDCSFIWGMVENYCPLGHGHVGEINLGLLFTSARTSALQASVNSRSRLNFTLGTIIRTIPLMSSQCLYIDLCL